MALAFLMSALLPSVSMAQSACTAMWGIVTTGGAAPTYLGYYNGSTGTSPKFTTLSISLSGGTSANGLAGDPATGLLYYFDRAGLNTFSINVNNNTTATVGTIAPASPDGNGAIIGAVVDASSNLIMMTSAGAGNTAYHMAIINKAGNTTAARWQTVTYTAGLGGGLPFSGGSGDLYIDQGNQMWIASNTTPTSAYPIAVTVVNGSITSALAGSSVTFNNPGIGVSGVSVDPATGLSYFGGGTTGQILYRFNPASSGSQVLVDASASTLYTISDLGNCALQPAKPTVTKSFANTYEAGGVGNTTTTLTLTFGNTNTAPIWLMQPFSDIFPAGMQVFNTVTFTSTCNTSVPSATITVGSTSMTWAAGGRIQAGGCSISFPVTATAAVTPYVNTIPAGSLTTTAGTNTLAAQATLTVGTDFTMNKLVRAGTTAPLTNSTSVGVLQTMQYVLTISNSTTGGTGSVTFSDTLPVRITPVLSITAVQVGGGTCSTATAVVGGQTVLTGTVTNALAGSTCTVTITAQGSSTVATFQNTATLVATLSTVDVVSTNNSSTATVTLSPAANITISKTNGVNGVTAGQTVVYTITVANLGPSAATPSFLTDPSVTGLSCTNAVACTATGVGSACPSAGSTTVAYLTAGGIQLNTFSSGNTLTFALTCGVTATGLP